jgi:predicted phage terminase large subunit-like protein
LPHWIESTVTPNEIADLQTDLLTFSRYMFRARRGVDMKEAPFHYAICAALERVVTGKTKRLIINIPPRSGKTEIAVKNFMAWCMGIAPDAEFIHASYSKDLATSNTWETRAIMQHEAYAAVFGAPKLRNDSNAKDHFRTEYGGVVYSTGADGTITGFGAGKMREGFGGAIIIDDPHKAGEANSKTMREKVISWFQVTMESRKNTVDTPIIVIMQRLHEEDLAGWLLSGGNGEKWDHVCIPAVTDNGASFWPEQFPIDDLERKRLANSYVFAGQYMQRPAPVGGGLFRDEWWQFYTAMPMLDHRAIYADTAQKTGNANDYSVFQCWGKTKMGQAVLIDQIRGKWEAPELLVQARAFWAKHKATPNPAPLRAMKIEDKVSGTGLIQTLKREGVPVLAIQRDRDKVTRAYDAAPLIESGNVLLPRDWPGLSDFLAEASVFPNGAHDDQLDPMMDAVTDMLQSTASEPSIRRL